MAMRTLPLPKKVETTTVESLVKKIESISIKKEFQIRRPAPAVETYHKDEYSLLQHKLSSNNPESMAMKPLAMERIYVQEPWKRGRSPDMDIPPRVSSLNHHKRSSSAVLSNVNLKNHNLGQPTFNSSQTALFNPIGLKNLGNSCFMNSIIQCLCGAEPLTRYFNSGSYIKHINRENPMGSKGKICTSFFDLMRKMSNRNDSVCTPIEFRDCLGSIAQQFTDGTQQDSHEFLSFLLDALHEDLCIITTKNSVVDGKVLIVKESNSYIKDLFYGDTSSQLQCEVCTNQSVSTSPFSSLALPVPAGSKITLGSCLEEFMRSEILDGDNAWDCSKCKRKVRAIQLMRLSRLPPILVITLKRFRYVGRFRDKIDSLISFPVEDFDLRQFLFTSEDARYDLFAVSNHYGGMDGGHCTSFIN